MPYWIQSTLLATPALVWLFLGVGLPWALVVVPRAEWRERATVACLTLAFGPALVTAWMFVLGSVPGQALLRLEWTAFGTGILALVGWLLVWRKRAQGDEGGERMRGGFATDEKLLMALIGLALVVRWLGVAYWPSTAYDAQWVYAYEGKLYTLVNHIPASIGYYPQFLPLLHTYLQLAVGVVDDHVARAILPFLHLGSILAAYLLGRRLFNRRVGLFTAAIWALYPHVGEWSRYGDLEIPVTFFFTGAAAFFVQAWGQVSKEDADEGRIQRSVKYAFIAGLFLGIGMWTKPTMGAFVWGMLLMLAAKTGVFFWEARHQQGVPAWVFRRAKPYVQISLVTSVTALPLGGVWYVRNIALGHNVIDFPTPFWQSLAARSGVELGWPLLAVLLVVGYVLKGRRGGRPKTVFTGVVLLLAAVLPSIINAGRVGINQNRMGVLEWAALAVGGGVLLRALMHWARGRWTEEGRGLATTVGWVVLLALPYFVTWFYSYSYHYRLSFPIVPLLIVPSALILARWTEGLTRRGRGWARGVYSLGILLAAIPGILAPLDDPNAGWDWLWTDKLPDDHARYASGNQALMSVVDGLQIYLDQNTTPLRVVAPGLKRLPFFFPLEDIRIDGLPTRLDELAGVTYFIYGTPESGGALNTLAPGQNQILSALSLASSDPSDTSAIMRRAWGDDDGLFKFDVYELHLERRFKQPNVIAPPAEGEVMWGDFVRFLGHDIGGSEFWQGRKLVMHLYWEVLAAPPADYTIYIHLRDAEGTLWETWDNPVTRSEDGNYYSTLVWQPGEYITDERKLLFDNPDAPLQEKNYRIVIGFYNTATQERLPVNINGVPGGDGYTLSERLSVIPTPP